MKELVLQTCRGQTQFTDLLLIRIFFYTETESDIKGKIVISNFFHSN